MRGLKFVQDILQARTQKSRPARGAWIEIAVRCVAVRRMKGRAPQGVRGLKYLLCVEAITSPSRAPQGVRGLKYVHNRRIHIPERSRPARGAWIEILFLLLM